MVGPDCTARGKNREPEELGTAGAIRVFYNLDMQFLSVSRRRTDAFPPEAFTPELTGGETARVKELYAAGTARQVWARADAGGAAILWEAADEAEARAALESLPLYRAGMLEVVVFVPLKPYAGFGPQK